MQAMWRIPRRTNIAKWKSHPGGQIAGWSHFRFSVQCLRRSVLCNKLLVDSCDGVHQILTFKYDQEIVLANC